MSAESRKIIREIYQAQANRNIEAVLALCDPAAEVEQTELLPWGGHYSGHKGLLDFLTRLGAFVESLPQPMHFIEAGNRLAVTGRLRGRVKSNGNEFDLNMVHVWTVRDGKATRFEAYIDTPGMLRALAG